MSADITSLPPWKLEIIERKRRQGDQEKLKQEAEFQRMAQMPLWKRELLAKRQQKSNMYLLSKSASSDAVLSSRTQGKYEITSPRQVKTENPIENGFDTTDSFTNDIFSSPDSVDADGEERILPLQQNPWLKTDLEKKKKHKIDTTGNDSRLHHSSSGSDINNSRYYEANYSHDSGKGEGDDVFINDLEKEELSYGRGFVHKLLEKFSHMSANDQEDWVLPSHAFTSDNILEDFSEFHSPSPKSKIYLHKPVITSPNGSLHNVDKTNFSPVEKRRILSDLDSLKDGLSSPINNDFSNNISGSSDLSNVTSLQNGLHVEKEIRDQHPVDENNINNIKHGKNVSCTRNMFKSNDKHLYPLQKKNSGIRPSPVLNYESNETNTCQSSTRDFLYYNETSPNGPVVNGTHIQTGDESKNELSERYISDEALHNIRAAGKSWIFTSRDSVDSSIHNDSMKKSTDFNANNNILHNDLNNASVNTITAGFPRTYPAKVLPKDLVHKSENSKVENIPNLSHSKVYKAIDASPNEKSLKPYPSTKKRRAPLPPTLPSKDVNRKNPPTGNEVDYNELPVQSPPAVTKVSANNISPSPAIITNNHVPSWSKLKPASQQNDFIRKDDLSVLDKVPSRSSDQHQSSNKITNKVEKANNNEPVIGKGGTRNPEATRLNLNLQLNDSQPPKAKPVEKPTERTNYFVKKSSDTSSKQKSVSGPGSLLIRPASNLVVGCANNKYLNLTKYNDIKTGDFAPAKKRPSYYEEYDDEMLVTNIDDNDLGVANVDDIALSIQNAKNLGPRPVKKVAFVNAGIIVDKSMLKKPGYHKEMHVSFNDAKTSTYEYPSEQSLMDATPPQPGDVDHPSNLIDPEEPPMPEPSPALKSSPGMASAGSLSSYKGRFQMDYEFGQNLHEEEPQRVNRQESPPTSPDQVKPADENDSFTWSDTVSSDILF